MHRSFRVDTLENRTLFATSLVSIDTTGGVGDGDSFNAALSGDGRFVAFASQASDLVGGDNNGLEDTFLRDRQGGTTTLVSVGPDGVAANGETIGQLAISSDGRFVAFASRASNLVANDTNDDIDVFLRDVLAGTSVRVSIGTGGAQPNAGSTTPSVSDDGRFVAFESNATNLVSGDGNSAGDVFVRDLELGVTTLVTARPNGEPAQTGGGNSVISGDGRFVAFESTSADFGPADGNDTFDVYVRDLDAQQTSRASVTSGGSGPNELSATPSISRDGRFVVFNSPASNLAPGPAEDDSNDVFVRDRVAGTTTLISVASGSTQGGNGDSSASRGTAISADGRFVVFQSSATNLVPDQIGNAGVFVRDLTAQTTTLVGAPAVGIVPDDFFSGSGISGDGTTVTLETMASNLIVGDVGGFTDVFVETNPPTPRQVPQFSVSGGSVTEGDNPQAPGSINFVIQLSDPFLLDASVSYATSDATASAGSDYEPASGSITIPAGQTTAQASVSVHPDTTFESTETFSLTLSNPLGATLATAQADGTIFNDDPEPPLTPLEPTVLARLPESAVSGQRARGVSATVNVANVGVGHVGPATVRIFLSPQTTLSAGAVQVGSVTQSFRLLLSNRPRAVRFRIPAFPSVLDGDYFLVAQVIGAADTRPRESAFGTPVRLAAPFVDLSATSLSAPATLGPGRTARLALALRNGGNVAVSGPLGVRVFASSNDALADDDAELGLATTKLKLNPQASRVARLRVAVPTGLAAGAYRLIAVIDADAAITESDEENNVITAGSASTLE